MLKDEFLSTVTHELRTPLTSIRALTELMFDEPEMDSAQRQEYLGVVISESERLTRLINQVLDAAKIEAGQMDWQIERFDLAAVPCARRRTACAACSKPTACAWTSPFPHTPVPVDGDRDRVSQVVLNLLSNALKFSPKATGRVTVALAPGRPHPCACRTTAPAFPTTSAKRSSTGSTKRCRTPRATHRHRAWSRDQPDDRGVSRRPDLGRPQRRGRQRVCVYAAVGEVMVGGVLRG